jgi:hypothetical protein
MSALPAVGSKGGHVIRPELRTQIERVIFDLKLDEPARRYIWGSIDSGPSRSVEGRGGNVLVNFHSRKTGLRLLLESRRGEHAGAILLEHDTQVLAFFAQPLQVDLRLTGQDGAAAGRTQYTPDMLVVAKDRIVVRETRDHTRLVKAHMTNPHQFYRDDAGAWHYRAAEEHFSALGLQFELLSNQSLPAVLVENVRFLEDYSAEGRLPLDPDRAKQLADVVKNAQRDAAKGAPCGRALARVRSRARRAC